MGLLSNGGMKGKCRMLLIEISIFVLTVLNLAVMFTSKKK